MGTTGILISKNIKFKILPSTNASLSDFTGSFVLKTNRNIAIFVWTLTFTCVDFCGKIYTTKVCRNRERYHLISWHPARLPLKPPQSFKPRTVIKTGFFVFLWIWPEPVRGSQREENFQKTSSKAQKNFSAFRPSFLFQTCFQYSLTVLLFYVMYASFRSVTAKNGKILTPTRTGNFLLT